MMTWKAPAPIFKKLLGWMLLVTSLATTLVPSEQSFAAETASPPSLWTRQQGFDWPRMLGPTGNGQSAETGIRTDWSDGKLAIRWSKNTGTGYGNGVASHGRWFQFDRFEDVERLSCYHAETGEQLWVSDSPVEYEDMYGYNNGPRSSAVVDQDLVYTYGVAGRLAAMDVVTGKVRWEKDTNKSYGVVQNFFGVGSTPCVFENLLIVMIGGSPAGPRNILATRLDQVKPNGSAIVAFDKRTGQEVYRVGNYLASYSAPIIASIHGQPWCIVLVREGLMVFDPRDGTKEAFFPWRASILESVNAAWPIVIDHHIFISETYEKGSVWLEFDGRQLKPIWTDLKLQKNQSMRAHWATPIHQDGFLFGCSGRNEPDADFRCIRVTDGAIQWVHRNRDRTNCLAVDGHLVVLGEHGLLQLVKATSERFELVSEVDLGDAKAEDGRPWLESPSWAPPVLSHGLLYLRGRNRVVCLELIPQ